MTLDEAIEHAKQVSIDKADESLNCDNECAREHWQLAEWLTELKLLRDAYGERQKEHSQLIIEHSDALYEIDELRELVRDLYKRFHGVVLENWSYSTDDFDMLACRMRELGVDVP